VRWVLVDRIVRLAPGEAIEVVKNVAASEDVFADHFPGCPVFPGALMVEVMEQAAALLAAASHAWTRTARLTRLERARFRHPVRPGDQLRVRLDVRGREPDLWRAGAEVCVEGRSVASASLELALDDDAVAAGRLRALHAELTSPAGFPGPP
jgi:3-hydroxyacyl-[acyl-carrier-protein] dehydratase